MFSLKDANTETETVVGDDVCHGMWLACGADDEPHVHVLAFAVDG